LYGDLKIKLLSLTDAKGVDMQAIEVRESTGIEQPRFSILPTGLVVTGEPNYEEWEAFGNKLAYIERGIHWALGDWLNYGERRWGEMYAQALGETVFSYQTLRDDKWLSKCFDLSRRRDKLSWSHHREVASFEPDEQDEWLDRAEQEGWTRGELRKAKAHHLREELEIKPVPEGLFNVILADPPWEYDFSPTIPRAVESHYPTMTVEEIKVMENPIADDAVLFLWATAPKLNEALDVMAAWGFKYKTHGVWDKRKIGMGYWLRGQHELFLIGSKGAFRPPEEGNRSSSVISVEREGHSVKPVQIYELIEAAFPYGQYLELFGRGSPRDGWTVWGAVND